MRPNYGPLQPGRARLDVPVRVARSALAKVSPLAWLVLASLGLLPFYLSFFYRVLGRFGVVGCAAPLLN